LLQLRKFLRHCAAGKPVIHAKPSGSETLKEQVAYKARVIGLTKLVVPYLFRNSDVPAFRYDYRS
jgi:hypothetical protein